MRENIRGTRGCISVRWSDASRGANDVTPNGGVDGGETRASIMVCHSEHGTVNSLVKLSLPVRIYL